MTVGAALLSALYLVVIAGCATFAAVRVSGRMASGLDRVLVAAVTVVSQGVGVPLSLAMLGLLSRWPVLAGHVLLTAAVAWLIPPDDRPAPPAGSKTARDLAEPSTESRAGWLSVAGASAALVTLATLPTLAGRLPGGTDTREYHIANLAAWLGEHSIWTMPFQNPGFFTATHPGNGELLGTTVVLATGQDHLLYLTGLVFGALLVVAVALLARTLGGRADLAALGALAVLGVPIIYTTHANSLLTDVTATSGVLAGVALLMRCRQEARPGLLLMAGVALGIGLGSKYTVLVMTAAVLGWAAVRFRRRSAWLVPGLLLFAGPWFARNLAFTGNPIHPQGVTVAGIEIFPGGQSPLLALRTSVLDHLVAGRWEVLERWFRLGSELYGPVTLLAIAGTAVALVRILRTGTRSRVAELAGLTVLAGVVYLITPWSGGGPEGLDFLMGSNLRYALTAILLGVTFAAVFVPRWIFVGGAGLALAYNAWRIGRGAGFRGDLDVSGGEAAAVVAAVAAALALGVWRSTRRRLDVRVPIYVGGAVTAVVLLGGLIYWVDNARRPAGLEVLVDQTGAEEVIVLGTHDVRSVLGRNLDRQIRTLTATDEGWPIEDPEELSEAVRLSGLDVLVVRPGTVAVPEGWLPPEDEWALLGSGSESDVYVRSAGGSRS